MGARELLRQAETLQISVFAEGDRLVVRPAHKLPPELRQALVDNRHAVLAVAPRRRWRVTPPGRKAFDVDCVVAPCLPGELLSVWPGAAVEPLS
jgi:hypothetical protein